MTDLRVDAKIDNNGTWVDLNNGYPYKLEANTAAQRSTSLRQSLVNNSFVEGSFTAWSVRESITESVNVWVYGNGSALAFRQNLEVLEEAFNQLSYQLTFTVDDLIETWTCFPAQIQVNTRQEFRVATMGLLQAQVPRLPALTIAHS